MALTNCGKVVESCAICKDMLQAFSTLEPTEKARGSIRIITTQQYIYQKSPGVPGLASPGLEPTGSYTTPLAGDMRLCSKAQDMDANMD